MKIKTPSQIQASKLSNKFGMLCISLLLLSLSNICNAQADIKTQYLWNLSEDVPAANALTTFSYLHAGFQNDYGLKELMHKTISMSWIRQRNSIYGHLSHYGFSKYGILTLQTGYARAFGPKVAVGMSVIYLLQHAESYNATHSITIDISGVFMLSHKLGLSVYLYNPVRLKYGFTGQDVIPLQFRIEAFYFFGTKLAASYKAEKYLPGNLELGISLLYHPISLLFMEGICSQQRSGIGIVCQWQNFSVGIKVFADYKLGITSLCQLNYFFTHEKHHPVSAHSAQSVSALGTTRHDIIHR